MFTDYLTLMLINMVVAHVVLSWFLWRETNLEHRACWAPAFGACGLVAAVCGFIMTFTWPLPGPYNIAYGELTVLLGVLFLAAAWAMAKNWNLAPLGIYAFFAGLTAVLMGLRFINLSLTTHPVMSGLGFILTGSGGILTSVVLVKYSWKGLRRLTALILLVAAAIWLYTAFLAYWNHMAPKT